MYQMTQHVMFAEREAAQREREMRQRDKMLQARRARCETEGCHPVTERISRVVLRLAMRFHCRVTPVARQRAALPCGC